jgi:hypothetical protein
MTLVARLCYGNKWTKKAVLTRMILFPSWVPGTNTKSLGGLTTTSRPASHCTIKSCDFDPWNSDYPVEIPVQESSTYPDGIAHRLAAGDISTVLWSVCHTLESLTMLHNEIILNRGL